MRRLIADIYKMLYKLTNNKLVSLSFALLYITALNLLTIYGLCFLLTGVVPFVDKAVIIFRQPYIYAAVIVGVCVNFWLMLPLENLSKEKSKPYAVGPIVVYTLATMVLFMYTEFADKFF